MCFFFFRIKLLINNFVSLLIKISTGFTFETFSVVIFGLCMFCFLFNFFFNFLFNFFKKTCLDIKLVFINIDRQEINL